MADPSYEPPRCRFQARGSADLRRAFLRRATLVGDGPGGSFESGRPGSNRRHPAWKAGALPTELHPRPTSVAPWIRIRGRGLRRRSPQRDADPHARKVVFFAVFAYWFFRFFWRKSGERTLTTHRRMRRVETVRRLAVLAAAAMLAAAAVSADAAAPAFRYGVAAGEITATSAILWTRAPGPGAVTVRVSRNRSLAASRLATANATLSDDLTLSIVVRGLSPGSRYYYEFAQGLSRSRRGTFVTAPGSTTSANVRFAISGDADATPGKDGRPGFNTFQVYAAMANEANASTSIWATPSTRTARSTERRSRGRSARSGASIGSGSRFRSLEWLRRSPASTATGTTTSSSTTSLAPSMAARSTRRASRRSRLRAGREPSANGLYRTFRWGKNLELFFLDERSFRSAQGYARPAAAISLRRRRKRCAMRFRPSRPV